MLFWLTISKMFALPIIFVEKVFKGFLKLSETIDCAARWKIISGLKDLISLDNFVKLLILMFFILDEDLSFNDFNKILFFSGSRPTPLTFAPIFF